MGKLINLNGIRFGRLRVMWRSDNKSGRVAWDCMCDCGNTVTVQGTHLKSNNTKSCGCLFLEQKTKHGFSSSEFYQIWVDMMNRCTNTKCKSYFNYGGRGITVCDKWVDPSEFCTWAENQYKEDDWSLERIDNNQGYNPDNCKFTSHHFQKVNRRVQKRSVSGCSGITPLGSKWQARITVNKKQIFLGVYIDIKRAVIARNNYIIENELFEYEIQYLTGR